MRFMLNMTFFGRCTEFLLGIGLALVVAKKSAENQPGAIYTMVGALGIVFYMAIVTFANHGRVQLGGPAFWLPYQILANNFLLPAVVCSLFYGLVKEQTALRRLLETPLFDLLGKSSYILYLIHLGAVDSLFRQYISDNSVICFIVYLLLSIVLYKTVEHPLHTRLRAKPRPKLAVG
jgi:peptidoglycan/LPS O-acetylase OafA/YrhL